MGFSVEKSGLMTTIQDNGRTGYRNIGMPVSGPMDTIAFRLANLLAGNEESAPALEVTMQGPVLHFTSDTELVLCGADLKPSINHEQISNNKPLLIKKGMSFVSGLLQKECACILPSRAESKWINSSEAAAPIHQPR